jgi:hypothetical protein
MRRRLFQGLFGWRWIKLLCGDAIVDISVTPERMPPLSREKRQWSVGRAFCSNGTPGLRSMAAGFPQAQTSGKIFRCVFANAALFHVPSQELPRVLRELHTTLKPRRKGPILSAGGHRCPQLQRCIDHAEIFKTAPGAVDRDIAVVEEAADQRLIDVDAFNFLHVHLDGVPTYKTTLQDDAAISDGNFGRPATKPGGNESAHGGYGGEDCDEQAKIHGFAMVRADDQNRQRANGEQNRRNVNCPANVCSVAHVLARFEDTIDIGHWRRFHRGFAVRLLELHRVLKPKGSLTPRRITARFSTQRDDPIHDLEGKLLGQRTDG